MQSAMHIGILVLQEMTDGVDPRAGLLRGCRVVEIRERMSVDDLIQDREFTANLGGVIGRGSGW